jgi:hypothetical protein
MIAIQLVSNEVFLEVYNVKDKPTWLTSFCYYYETYNNNKLDKEIDYRQVLCL